MSRYAQLAFTDPVRQVQAEQGSADQNRRRLECATGRPDPLGEKEMDFVRASTGFYMGTVGVTGWPYVQHRGGPPGFVQVLDEHTLAFADVRGNRQYVSTGNLRINDRAALFFMDYVARKRLKVLGHARVTGADDEPELADRLDDARTDGIVERLLVVDIEGLSWNCPKHITQRWTEAEYGGELAALRARITVLEQENTELRQLTAVTR